MEKKKLMNQLGISLRVGKNGITLNILEEIKKYIKKNKFMKIKFLKAFTHSESKEDAIKFIESKLNVELIDHRGNVILIGRKSN